MAIITSSIGSSGRTYSTLQAWEDALPADVVASGNSYVGETYADSEFTGSAPLLTISGQTTDATHTITLKCAAGQSFYDNAGKTTNALRYNAANGVGIRSTAGFLSSTLIVQTNNVTLDGLQVCSDFGSSSANIDVSGDNVTIKNVIAQVTSTDGNNSAPIAMSGTGVITNCAAITESGSDSGPGMRVNNSIVVTNCTVVRTGTVAGTGFSNGYAAPTIRNCVVVGFASFSRGSSWPLGSTSDYNATDLASGAYLGPGSHNVTGLTPSATFQSVTPGAPDVRVKAGSGLIGIGVRDNAYTNDLDIVKQARSTTAPTVGSWEFITANIALISTGTTINRGAATLSTGIALASAGTTKNSGAAALVSSITLAAAGTTKSTGAATLSTGVALSATGTTKNAGTAALSTGVALSAAGTTKNAGTAALSTSIALASAGTTVGSGAAALTTSAVWAATGTTANSSAATLSTGIALASAGTTKNSGAAALGVAALLSATGTTFGSGAASLTTSAVWAATGTTINSGTASVSTGIALASAGTTRGDSIASLNVTPVWAATGTTANSSAAALSTTIALGAVAKTMCSSSASLGIAAMLACEAITRSSGSAELSTGYPSNVGQVSITTAMLARAIRAFVLGLTLNPTTGQPQRVLIAPVNRAVMPKDSFVVITPGAIKALSTNVHETVNTNLKRTKRASQFTCRVDCYGPGSGDLANTVDILFRDQYAVDVFATTGLDIAPLYAGDIMQMPLVTGEEQYEDRWTFELVMQFNPVVPIAQQSANILTVDIINVDANYSP